MPDCDIADRGTAVFLLRLLLSGMLFGMLSAVLAITSDLWYDGQMRYCFDTAGRVTRIHVNMLNMELGGIYENDQGALALRVFRKLGK